MNKKFIPLLLILILLVCITTGIIVSNKYLDDNKDISEDNLNSIVNGLSKPLRKCMHSFVFFILVILF